MFLSEADAVSQGYRPCNICFMAYPAVPDYWLERRLGESTAAEFRAYHPVVTDDHLNGRVRASGERVLRNWPVPLKGYTYRFYVVESEAPNAVACPAGIIFVTTGLMHAVESDSELDAVMAHEIAHVERRHGLRQFRSVQSGTALSVILGAAVGVAVGAATGDPGKAGVAGELTAIVAGLGAQIAMAGYSREHELEADAYGIAYASRTQGISVDGFVTLLEKLKYSQTVAGISGLAGSSLSSHPEIDDRIARARNVEVDFFAPATRFVGYDADDVPLVAITLESQVLFDYLDAPPAGVRVPSKRVRELQLFATCEGLPDLEKPINLATIRYMAGKQEFALTCPGGVVIYPGASVGTNFKLTEARTLLPTDKARLSGLMFPINYWAAESTE
jgi:Zn-dependent protease with chaperone function